MRKNCNNNNNRKLKRKLRGRFLNVDYFSPLSGDPQVPSSQRGPLLKTGTSVVPSPCQHPSPVLKSTYCAFAACQLKITLKQGVRALRRSFRRGRLCPLLAAQLHGPGESPRPRSPRRNRGLRVKGEVKGEDSPLPPHTPRGQASSL